MASNFKSALTALIAAGSLTVTTQAQAGNGVGLGVGIGLGILAVGAMANAAEHRQRSQARASSAARAKAQAAASQKARYAAAQREKAEAVARARAEAKAEAAQKARYAAAQRAKADASAEQAQGNADPQLEPVKSATTEATDTAPVASKTEGTKTETAGKNDAKSTYVAAPSTANLLTRVESQQAGTATTETVDPVSTKVAAAPEDKTEAAPVTEKSSNGDCKKFVPSIGVTVSVACE